MTSSTTQSLWLLLKSFGLVDTDTPPETETQPPWYIRAMLGVAGWFGATFLFSFFGIVLSIALKVPSITLIIGLLVITGAFFIFRSFGRNDFATQFGLVFSLSGQGLAIFALFRFMPHQYTMPCLLAALLLTILVLVIPNFIHRTWSSYAAATFLSMALAAEGAYFLAAGLISAAAALAWLLEFEKPKRASLITPTGYGLTLALIQIEGFLLFHDLMLHLSTSMGNTTLWVKPWMGELLSLLVLIVVVWRLLARQGLGTPGSGLFVVLFATILVGALSFKAPGISIGFMIVLLGYAAGNRVLVGLGFASLLFYISTYYYTMETTLLYKSQILAATGVVLLAAQWVLARFLFNTEEEADYA